ncbi:GABPI [Trypoxylus dichotomus]
MISDNNPLCCCEYFDLHDERNHILACCCNCQDFDEGFDSFIGGRGIPRHNHSGFMATLHDRLRIPWKGGAKRISIEVAVSFVLIPIFLLIASLSPMWTAISGVTMIIFLSYIKLKVSKAYPRTRFFFAWMNVSCVVLYLIFEFVVIPFLEILWEENVGLTAMIMFATFWFWKAKKRRSVEGLSRNCLYCMAQVPNDSRHCDWLHCCIGPHNSRQYLMGLFSAVTALLYGSELTLTTVCHPFMWFHIILLPDDCTEAYDLFELSLAFVSGIYSLAIAIFLAAILVHQITLSCCNVFRGSFSYKKLHENFMV